MGLMVDIFKANGRDCSNGGLSSKANKVTVTNIEGPHEPTPDAPAVVLVRRASVGNIVAVPEDFHALDKQVMSGGCFIYSSDGRFNRAIETVTEYEFGFPIALFDRVEG